MGEKTGPREACLRATCAGAASPDQDPFVLARTDGWGETFQVYASVTEPSLSQQISKQPPNQASVPVHSAEQALKPGSNGQEHRGRAVSSMQYKHSWKDSAFSLCTQKTALVRVPCPEGLWALPSQGRELSRKHLLCNRWAY